MKASEIMTPSPKCCTTGDTATDVAKAMRDCDCGAVPIIDKGSRAVVGIVTDRDLAIRVLAEGRGGDTSVSEVMTASPRCCKAEDDIREVERVMSENQVRRVPIIDVSGNCVGIVSQADIATKKGDGLSDREVASVVERISEPGRAGFDRGQRGELEQRL